MNIYVAYTGSRRSEVIGLRPECIHDDQVAIDWKLYELNGRFYRGRPKDGSMRPADLPPFLAQLLAGHLASAGSLAFAERSISSCSGGVSDQRKARGTICLDGVQMLRAQRDSARVPDRVRWFVRRLGPQGRSPLWISIETIKDNR